jgi:predicted ATPase/class 3 adenylate cyclase
MPELPTGTVTFLFTDIEGSTRLLQELGEGYRRIQDRHAEIMRAAFVNGHEIRTEGDSFFVVFRSPVDAARAAVEAQRALSSEDWPHGAPLRVRMGMHTGEGVLGGDDYLGIDVNRAARIAAAGHGGQVLISDATRGLVEHSLPEGVALRDLGLHRLKDIGHPERMHDLVIDGLAADFPPIRTLDVRPTNLPPLRTSFVGRERELAEISELLAATRLLTLTGPGGTGKTRLALRVAEDLLERFSDGVFFVDLAPLTDPALVLGEIASTLRILEGPGRAVADTLAEQLRDREMLLVLDNMEQLVQAAPAVAALLDAAPLLRVLATSRVPLRVQGEQEYHVRPLPLPRAEEIADLERLTTCESVRLFAERAAAVRPGFRITEETAPAVAEIASRLDGLPLALELAASRVKVLGPRDLSDRLQQRLPLLTGGARDLPERHRTLRGAIEWSHGLLGPDEQRLLARLSIFAGGWTLQAAEAVCNADIDVLEGLEALVDSSLVRRRDLGDGSSWFRMLETIREYAAERLASSGERPQIRRRHADHVLALVEEAQPQLTREHQGAWIEGLEREHDNLRAALDYADEAGEAEIAVRIAAAVWRFWQQRGYLAEARARTERLLDFPEVAERGRLRAAALTTLGNIVYWQGDYERMAPLYEEALGIARELGDRRLLAEALNNASFIPLVRGEVPRLRSVLEDALVEAQAAGDRALEASIRNGLAFQHMLGGDLAAAREAIEEVIVLHRDAGDLMFLAETLLALAAVDFFEGDLVASTRRIKEGMRINVEIRYVMGVAVTFYPLAVAAVHQERYVRAAILIGASNRWQEELGGGPPAFVLEMFGNPEVAARDHLDTEEFERTLAEGRAMSFDEAVAFALEEEGSNRSASSR